MGVSHATAVVEDLRYRDHRGPGGHPECPERLAAVSEAIAQRAGALRPIPPRPAEDAEILRVHDAAHLKRVAEAAVRGPVQLDPDTYVAPASLDVARLAAGGAIDLACQVARGEVRNGFAAVRPPGHHAESTHAMGFCLFNNVAIAARALQAEEGVERSLIVDWDVHHGNGTQHCFEEDPSVLYLSMHQFPYYPGTGDHGEAGRGRGVGATVNVPMPAGCGDEEYVGVFQRIAAPVTRSFRPEVILISCGFDAHRDDPLAAMNVSGEGFRAMARHMRVLAEDLCEGRLALVLEGGYSASGLREGTDAALGALLDPSPPAPGPASDLAAGATLARIVERVAAVHAEHHPGIGTT